MITYIDSNKKGAIAEFMKQKAKEGATIYIPSSIFTIYAFNELKDIILKSNKVKFLFNKPTFIKKIKNNEKDVKQFKIQMNSRECNVSESPFEISLKNNLDQNSVAKECYLILDDKFEVRSVTESPYFNDSQILIDNENGDSYLINGTNLEFSMLGLGYIKGNGLVTNYAIDDQFILEKYKENFDEIWNDPSHSEDVKTDLLKYISNLYKENSPELVFYITLFNLFNDKLVDEDESSKIKEGTGITKTKVWDMLFNFQKDAVIGAIHKLMKFNGCIIADSVGLGKTFEALAIIKYFELRNDRVLVLTPKKLRPNWTGFKNNVETNPLVDDKFRYDVLNHTDLSRTKGLSGDIKLEELNWGNYDLVVIDESHAFRNDPARKDRVTRYSRLMDDVVKNGSNTKVLMLSATPVNNRLTDLRNQIRIINKDNDAALSEFNHGVQSISGTLQAAQYHFNQWAKLEPELKTNEALLNMLDYSFFDVLDTYTIARSRKHIVKYYDTKGIGKFPERNIPLTKRPPIDLDGKFPSIAAMNEEILMLHLCVYSPLSYVLPSKINEYAEKYDTEVKDGKVKFTQVDREKSLVNLMRINILKRLESGVSSFGDTVGRILKQVDSYLDMLDSKKFDSPTEFTDPDFDEEGEDEVVEVVDESELEIGNKVKVRLCDIDQVRFKNDLLEDKQKLVDLVKRAAMVNAKNDAKLKCLMDCINDKINNPINTGNKKIIVFTAFADTAKYLYDNLSDWLLKVYGIYSGIVTGSSKVATNLPNASQSFETILACFSPKSNHLDSKKCPKEIDLLIATDCVSEGQNLQDCDYLVNYDIHWNPVRIIQRFGRIDRIGSQNDRIQLVNFWPNMDLDEYIKLEKRVRDRMVIVDATATGEDDLLNPGSKNLDYRKAQLEKLQSQVVDIDDIKGGISIADLTLEDFILSLDKFKKENPELLEKYPTGVYAICDIPEKMKNDCVPGVIFCLKQKQYSEKEKTSSSIYPHYLVYVTDNGDIHVKPANPKQTLDMYKGLCMNNKNVLWNLVNLFNKETKNSNDMSKYSELLKKAIYEIKGITEEKGISSLFSGFSGGSAVINQIKGLDDFELISFLVVK